MIDRQKGPRECYRSDGWPKRRYMDRYTARKAVREVTDRSMHVYRCGTCGFWHIGHE